ncbi:cytochrome P450 [Amycolatopsis sp. GM8]|uniref:cytochrome P450 n=1 Tax=Amycolatopsis sp. GM8 TaxID=2896530 RepID=UPI001F3577A8|nr:cytochrome P450 [Amycolatopsis sp. GM8]
MESVAAAEAAGAPVFPQPRECPYQPTPAYQRLGEAGPMHEVTLWNGARAWFVTGDAHARQLLSDPRFSADRARPEFPVVLPRFDAAIFKPLYLIGFDPPTHEVHRGLLTAEFSLRRVRALRPAVEQLVGERIDDMLRKGPPADLVRDFALPVPSIVISELLGVPYVDHDFFEEATRGLLQAADEKAADAAGQALLDYLDKLLTIKQREPDGRVLAKLAEHLDEEITRHDLLRIALTLLVGGHDTTSMMIALGVVTLLEHPDQLDLVRADPEKMPAAVEELLRIVAVTDMAGVRVATEDVEIGGQVIKAGEGILVSSSMTNRDSAAYESPYTFDIGRTGSKRHLTFGFGIHQCLGQNLARMELEVAFRLLFERIPELRLAAGLDELPWRRGGTMQGVHELPVTW